MTIGTTTIGYVAEHDGSFFAFDLNQELIGEYETQREAMRAIPKTVQTTWSSAFGTQSVMTIDLNRANTSETPLDLAINELIERAEPPSENYRQYLGASSIGTECLRKIQYSWMCDPVLPVRTKDIFERGHFFENVTRKRLIAAGFSFAPAAERLAFKAADGLFRGHADGILTGRTTVAWAVLSLPMGAQGA